MMGRSHVTMGACAVALASGAQVIDWETPNVALLTAGLVLAGTVLPDIDHQTSHVTRSFGPVTAVASDITRFFCRRIYRATRTRHDPAKKDPHRTFTHTWPGAVLVGGLLTLCLVAHPIAASVAVAMLFGMAARAWSKSWQPAAALAGGGLTWDIWPTVSGSLWTFWIALSVGCWLHVYTDCVTKAGAPLAWPKVTEKRETMDDGTTRVVQRRRWHMTGPPHWIRFYAGSRVETWIVRGTVVLTLVGTYLLATS